MCLSPSLSLSLSPSLSLTRSLSPSLPLALPPCLSLSLPPSLSLSLPPSLSPLPPPLSRIVSLLVPVTSRARLRGSGISPLHLAAHNNRLGAAAVLLRAGADVNAPLSHQRRAQHPDQRTSPLYFAVAGGATETAELLLRAGASLTLDPVSPLLLAARQGSLGTVELLLEYGADANVSVPSYPTRFPGAVALAVAGGVAVLRCLLDHGSDARACFGCRYGPALHPACPPPSPSRSRESRLLSAGPQHHSGTPALTCKESSANGTQVQ